MKKALLARNLGVSFGKLAALNSFDLELHPGERVALLGPNGAGKTTLLRTLLGVLRPTNGQTNAAEFRIGSVLEQPGLPRNAISSSYLRLHARLQGLLKFDAQAELARAGVPDRAWHTLSLGQKQQLQLSRSLIRQPEILLLDEPTSNLDPLARKELWERLEDWNGKGGGLLWATHDLAEAREHAHRILIMNQGTLRWEGTPADFEASYPPGWRFCPDAHTVIDLPDRKSVQPHLSRQLSEGAIPHSFGPDPKGLLQGYAKALTSNPLGSRADGNLRVSPLPPPAFSTGVTAIMEWEIGLLRQEPRVFLPLLILGALFLVAQSATPVLLPTLFLLPMGLSASLACDMVAGERERQSLDTLLATGIPIRAALMAKLLTAWVSGFLPGLVLTLLACVISRSPFGPALSELSLGTLTATSIAARLAVTSKSVRSATQISVLATLAVSLAMTAPLFLPWNLMPGLAALGLLLPPALLVSASRKFVA